ncbi:MAG: hypothetical protein KDG52_01005 [Rhodocyclaceae bacterium]|nr:hypothetical protein [Rhodocyclaceae bacterium]
MKVWLCLLAALPLTATAADVEVEDPVEARQQADHDETLATGAWSLAHEDLGGGHHRLRLTLERLHTGDDGGARLLVRRWAERRLRAGGLAAYELIRYEEGVRSGWFVGRRYVEAELRLVRSVSFGEF